MVYVGNYSVPQNFAKVGMILSQDCAGGALMPLSDADLCRIVARSYTKVTWWIGELSALYTLYTGVGGGRVIAIPGTKHEIGEWLRDFDAWPVWDRQLGICHRGFRDGARQLWRSSPLASMDFGGAIIAGHSLGGALALLLAGILIAERTPPAAVVTFGAPRCGSWKLRRLLSPIAVRSYRNGDDPVPEVPWLPGIYVHPRPQIEIGTPAPDPIADHHIGAYEMAVGAYEGQP